MRKSTKAQLTGIIFEVANRARTQSDKNIQNCCLFLLCKNPSTSSTTLTALYHSANQFHKNLDRTGDLNFFTNQFIVPHVKAYEQNKLGFLFFHLPVTNVKNCRCLVEDSLRYLLQAACRPKKMKVDPNTFIVAAVTNG